PPTTPTESAQPLRIRQPHHGLQMALDPRIPDDIEAFRFQLNRDEDIERVDWFLNGGLIGSSKDSTYNWPLQRGRHALTAKVLRSGSEQWMQTQTVEFLVK